MHQLKEVDMLSAKMDLLMKNLEDWANEKQEVMHIHDSRMTCEECGNTEHSENQQKRPNYQGNYQDNYQGNNFNNFQTPLRDLIAG